MAEGSQRSRKVITGLSVLGIEKRYVPNKHYLYILSVKWSEGSEFIIYRRYSAFFQLHQKLSELFPIETGAVSKKDQTIPPLPKQRWFGNEKFKVADERILTIDEYCRKVAMAEPKISEHEAVLQFFEALPEDLTPPPPDPKKPNKTYLTFESKNGGNKVKEKSAEDMEISAPILLETYRAIATFTPSGKTEVRLEEGAHVDVVEKNMSGWWLVQADDKQGWCPASYLEPLDQPEERDEERPNWEGEEFLTTEKYEPQIDDEIGFDKGVIVYVIHKLLDGWWIVRYNDKVGYAPCAYLQKYTNPHLPLHKARASTNSDTSTGSFIKRLPPRRSTIRKRSSAHGNEPKQRDLQIYRRKTLEASKSKRSRLAAKAKEAYRRVSAVTEEPEEEGTYMDMAPDTVANTDKEGYVYPENTAKTPADHAYVNDSVVEEIANRKRASSSDPRSTLTGTDMVTESSDVYVSDEEVLAEGPEGYLLPNDTEKTPADHPYVNENLVEEIAGRNVGPRSTDHDYVNENALAQGAASLGNTYVCVETQESAHRRKTNNSTDDVWAPAFVSAKPKGKAAETRNSNSSSKSVWVPAFADKEGAYMDMDGDTVAKTDGEGYIQPNSTANLPDPYVNEIVVEEIASRKTSSSSAQTRSSNSSTQSVWAPAFVDQEKSKKKFPKNPNYIDSNTVASMAGKKTKHNGQTTRYLNLGYVPDAPVSSSAWNKGPNSHDNTVASTDSAYENIDVQQQNITKGSSTTRPERAPRSPRTSRAPVPAPRGTTPTLLSPETEFKSNSGTSTPKSGRSTPRSGLSSPRNGRLSPSIPARPTAAEIAAKCSPQTKQRMRQQTSEDSVLSSPSGRSTPKDGHSAPKSPRSRPKSSNSSPNAQRKGTIVEGLAAKFGKVLQRK